MNGTAHSGQPPSSDQRNMDCPLLVWMLSLNRDTTQEVRLVIVLGNIPLNLDFKEYDQCYNLVRECAPHTNLPYQPTSVDSFSEFYSGSCYVHWLNAHNLQGKSSQRCYRYS